MRITREQLGRIVREEISSLTEAGRRRPPGMDMRRRGGGPSQSAESVPLPPEAREAMDHLNAAFKEIEQLAGLDVMSGLIEYLDAAALAISKARMGLRKQR